MTNSKEKICLNYIIPVLLIFIGILCAIFSMRDAYYKHEDEQKSHLQSMVWSTDRNLDNIFSNTSYKLSTACEVLSNRIYASSINQLSDILKQKDSDIDGVLIVQDLNVIANSEINSNNFDFPYGYDCSHPCICLDENGTEYLAIIHHTDNSYVDTDLVALIKISHLFKMFKGKELPDYYWMALYNADIGYCLVDQNTQQYIIEENQESALKRNDWLTCIARSEKNASMITSSCDVNSPEGDISNWLISSIPKKKSKNSHFAVGIAVPSSHYSSLVFDVLWKAVLSALFVIIGILLFIKMNQKSREENLKYQLLLDATQEMSHHQRLETIGTMASKVNHEFSNLLTPIMAYSLMAIDCAPEDNEELMEYLDNIYQSSKEAKQEVSQLLKYARKGISEDYVLLSPDDAIKKSQTIISTMKPDNVNVSFNLACPEKCIMALESQIDQIYINLAKNAFEAMDKNGGYLTVSSWTDADKVFIKVSDTGCGIPEDQINHIFEPFHSTKKSDKGTGLGLSIVYSIVETLHGKIEVSSTISKGTSFTITFNKSQ